MGVVVIANFSKIKVSEKRRIGYFFIITSTLSGGHYPWVPVWEEMELL